MTIEDIGRIQNIISKAETQKARSEGVIEKIKSEWKEKYGTDDLSEIKKKLSEMESEIKTTSERKESLFQKLLDSNDWEKLEEELDV